MYLEILQEAEPLEVFQRTLKKISFYSPIDLLSKWVGQLESVIN
jgi:hypothetical protein